MPGLDFLKDQADWGEFVTRNVDPRAPNNVTTRARRNRAMADREAYDVAREQQGEADFRNLATRDRSANAYLLGQERLKMQQEVHTAKMEAGRIKQEAESELFPLRKNALIAQTKSATALERARTQAADFKAKMDEQEHNDTTAFTQFILSSGARRGTPEFANVVAEARMKFPAVPSVLFDDTWRMTGSSRTPDEVMESMRAARERFPKATITATERGTTVVDRPPAEPRPAIHPADLARIKDIDKTILEKEQTWRENKRSDPNAIPSVEADIVALRKQRAELVGEGTRTTPSEPAPAAESKPKAVKQNGVIYYLQPDGSYKPVGEATAERPIFRDKFGNRAYKNTDGTFEPIEAAPPPAKRVVWHRDASGKPVPQPTLTEIFGPAK